MSVHHLKTKLNIPPPRPNLVLRPRLINQLEEGGVQRNRLTLVSAKAGSGKTTLVSEWLQQKQQFAAWLSLDASDNDPHRFISYLAAALDELGITVGKGILNQLERLQLPQFEALLTEIIENITGNPVPIIIVLDDYHTIQNEWIHKAIEFLIEYQPAGLQLICITRIDPPFPLAQLRARSQLAEIRDNDLRFNSEETIRFFNETMALDLPAEVIATLEERTEGWIAGLQLAAISVKGYQRDDDLASYLKAFGGTNRFLLDYLMEEILQQQSSTIQDFLLETAILKRMCGDLCDAVRFSAEANMKRTGSQTILEELEKKNLFVIPLDDERRWYRYHHLFADLLKSTLKQRISGAQIRTLHSRACQWHQLEGNLEEAMSHAMSAQDYERAAMMIDENIAGMYSRSEIPVLLGWIEKLPEHIVLGRPWIDIHRANTLVISGRPDEVDPLLKDIEKRIKPNTPRSLELRGHIAAVRAYAANLNGDVLRSIKLASLAKEYLPIEHPAGRGTAAYTLADTYFACDDMESAAQELQDMLLVGKKSKQLMIIIPALCELAAVKKTQGQLYRAKEFYDQAYLWLEEMDGLNYRLRCAYEFGIADLYREWNRLDAALEHAITGDEYRQRFGGYLMVGDLTLMRIHQARGDAKSALEALHTAERIMEAHKLQLGICVEFRTSRVLQWLAVGDIEMANHCAEDLRGGSEREQIALSRLRLAQGRVAEAQRLLDKQRELAESGGRTGRFFEILCLQSIALISENKTIEATANLLQALSLARPEGYIRTFIDPGQPIQDLLKQVKTRNVSAKKHSTTITQVNMEYILDLLKAFEQDRETQSDGESQDMIPPLTDRELEVLQFLAEGLSNKAIAEKLVVAPSTVKQHLKNIFNKLDAHTRTQAVSHGRELGLL
jgi:LuxR family transcriptional regulator, maltose regulon positive regulatory protein